VNSIEKLRNALLEIKGYADRGEYLYPQTILDLWAEEGLEQALARETVAYVGLEPATLATHLAARESAVPAAPDGYAYRYPDGIRFTDGRTINGSKPIEAIPYYFWAAHSSERDAPADLSDILISMRTVLAFAQRPDGIGGNRIAPSVVASWIEKLEALRSDRNAVRREALEEAVKWLIYVGGHDEGDSEILLDILRGDLTEAGKHADVLAEFATLKSKLAASPAGRAEQEPK